MARIVLTAEERTCEHCGYDTDQCYVGVISRTEWEWDCRNANCGRYQHRLDDGYDG